MLHVDIIQLYNLHNYIFVELNLNKQKKITSARFSLYLWGDKFKENILFGDKLFEFCQLPKRLSYIIILL